MTTLNKVAEALKSLSDATDPAEIFFCIHYTTKRVAKEAGVSEASARYHLSKLVRCRGFYRKRFSGGAFGYRCEVER
jgi:hypothetical protein